MARNAPRYICGPELREFNSCHDFTDVWDAWARSGKKTWQLSPAVTAACAWTRAGIDRIVQLPRVPDPLLISPHPKAPMMLDIEGTEHYITRFGLLIRELADVTRRVYTDEDLDAMRRFFEETPPIMRNGDETERVLNAYGYDATYERVLEVMVAGVCTDCENSIVLREYVHPGWRPEGEDFAPLDLGNFGRVAHRMLLNALVTFADVLEHEPVVPKRPKRKRDLAKAERKGNSFDPYDLVTFVPGYVRRARTEPVPAALARLVCPALLGNLARHVRIGHMEDRRVTSKEPWDNGAPMLFDEGQLQYTVKRWVPPYAVFDNDNANPLYRSLVRMFRRDRA